jgi:outer membrane protein OmpA-like peptidoglycan-associated protein/tetratricopeptide (TPR) repeat protein
MFHAGLHDFRIIPFTIRTGFIFFLLCTFSCLVQAQGVRQANKLFKEKNYAQALVLFEKDKKTEKNPDYLLRRATCYYHTKQLDKCLSDLKLYEVFKTGEPEYWRLLGLTLVKKTDYREGAATLKKFVSLVKPDHPHFAVAIDEIRRCGFAIQLQRAPQIAFAENTGNVLNSPNKEMRPVFSPNFQDRIYFSSNREGSTGGKRNAKGLIDFDNGDYYTDMYYSDFTDGNWTTPTTFLPLLNTPKHDMVQDFNGEGNILYYAVTDNFTKFEFYSDTFSTEFSYDKLPVRTDLPLQSEEGDKDLFFFNDSLLFFASSNLPGFGGYDIFYCQKKNGRWESPVNLGAEINSPKDDISPYLTKGGNTLYFSSDRLQGMGGFDIFSVHFDVNRSKWKEVKNLGYPINSTWDEHDFVISPDGMSGIFTSDKPGGFGQSDIYQAYFKDQIIEQLLFAEIPAFIHPEKVIEQELVDTDIKPKKIIRVPSLFYTSNDDVLSSANRIPLVALSEIMLVYPDTKLTVYSHSFQETSRDMDLYLSMKRAESIRDFLQQKGINPTRLTLKACGSSFPLATPYINGIKSNIAEKNNKRIDFQLSQISSDIEIVRENVSIASPFRDERYDLLTQAEDTLVFRLLIAQSQQMYRTEVLNLYDEIYIEKSGNQETNQYLLGNYDKYFDAVQMKKDLFQQHNIKAAILPYFKGKLLPKELYANKLNTLPELLLFVRYED